MSYIYDLIGDLFGLYVNSPMIPIVIIIFLTIIVVLPGFLFISLPYRIRTFITYSIFGLTIIMYSFIFIELSSDSNRSGTDVLAGLVAMFISSPLLISSAILFFVHIKKIGQKKNGNGER